MTSGVGVAGRANGERPPVRPTPAPWSAGRRVWHPTRPSCPTHRRDECRHGRRGNQRGSVGLLVLNSAGSINSPPVVRSPGNCLQA